MTDRSSPFLQNFSLTPAKRRKEKYSKVKLLDICSRLNQHCDLLLSSIITTVCCVSLCKNLYCHFVLLFYYNSYHTEHRHESNDLFYYLLSNKIFRCLDCIFCQSHLDKNKLEICLQKENQNIYININY